MITANDVRKFNKAIVHLLLSNDNVSQEVTKSERWVKDQEVECIVTFNGVKADQQVFEDLMSDWYNGIQKHFESKYSDVEAEIQKRVKEDIERILNTGVQKSIDDLYDLINKLNDVPEQMLNLINLEVKKDD